jgi:hypothetical protein
VTPATQDIEVGGSLFEATLDKVNLRPYLEKQNKKKHEK